MSDIAHGSYREGRDRDFRLIFLLTYAIFLVGAAAGRLLPRRRTTAFAAARPRSIFAEARASAYRTIPYAF